MESIEAVLFLLLELLPKNCGCFGHSLVFLGISWQRHGSWSCSTISKWFFKKAFWSYKDFDTFFLTGVVFQFNSSQVLSMFDQSQNGYLDLKMGKTDPLSSASVGNSLRLRIGLHFWFVGSEQAFWNFRTWIAWREQKYLTIMMRITNRIHGTGIFAYIYHKNQPFMDR